MITNTQSGTSVDEIADGIYRINTPVAIGDGKAFSFNQYLVKGAAPLLFHTGPPRMVPLVSSHSPMCRPAFTRIPNRAAWCAIAEAQRIALAGPSNEASRQCVLRL